MNEDPLNQTGSGTYAEPSAVAGDAGETVTGPSGAPGGPIEQLGDSARRAFLAGIGAVALARDNAQETLDRLVVRGEQVQHEWQDRAERVQRQNAGARGRMRDSFRAAMDAFLDAVNVPNKSDVDTINVKLNILSRKLDDLQVPHVHTETPGQPDIGSPATPPPDTDQAT